MVPSKIMIVQIWGDEYIKHSFLPFVSISFFYVKKVP